MPKLTEYPQATGFDANDILIKDGVNGTKKITIEDFIEYIGGRASFKDHGVLTSSDNLNDVTEMGTYTINSREDYKPVGFPTEMIGTGRPAQLIVFKSASTASGQSFAIYQYLVSPSTVPGGIAPNMIIYRYRNSDTWFPWCTVSVNRALTNANDLDDIVWSGVYRCSSTSTVIPQHMPVNDAGTLIVYSPTYEQICQMLVTKSNGIYYRFRFSDGIWMSWSQIKGTSMPGIPVLTLSEWPADEPKPESEINTETNISNMTKETKILMKYNFFNRSGYCTVKWQGSSSLRYAKKNYTIKLDEKMDAMVNYMAFNRSVLMATGAAGGYKYSQYEFSTKNAYASGNSVYYDGKFYQFTAAHPAGTAWSSSDVNERPEALTFRPWGSQKKFVAKANWIDPSATRNVANARLWGQMVATRVAYQEINDGRADAPNYGAIDGFPISIELGGKPMGLFTFTIPKDAWMFNMVSDDPQEPEYVVGGENNNRSECVWKSAIGVNDWSNVSEYDENSSYTAGTHVFCGDTLYRCKTNTTDPAGAPNPDTGDLSTTYWDKLFAVEYNTDDTSYGSALESFNTALASIQNSGANWENDIEDYMDIDSIYDYFIFTLCIANNDALARNILYGTYDGVKWFMSAYDLDTSHGFDPYGASLFPVKGDRTNFANASTFNKLVNLMCTYSKSKLKARYKLWREGGYSGEEATGWTDITAKKYMKTDVAVGETVQENDGSNNVRYIKVPCSPGDIFTIVTTGGTASRAWAFVDSSDKLISAAANKTTIATPTTFVAPENAAYFIVNDTVGTGSVYSGGYFQPVLSDENVWYTFSNFGKDISTLCYDADRVVWPNAVDTSIANISQFMDYYRMHCKYLDKEIEAM